jgi:16S rRNA (cytidine1402-2'-O)-methyltransferase
MAAGLEPGPEPVGTLYVVATPIGNLEDITVRALRVLREVALIAAEDTRRTRILLTHYGITTPLLSYREQNRAAATRQILERLASGAVALVSDAGMPGISDPGAELVGLVAGMGGRVEVLPGANAALTALVASGLPPAPFTFVGFLSRQRGDRRRQLAALAPRTETLVCYEAPHRLLETLRDLRTVLGDRRAATCRELTKLHEEIRRGSLDDLIAHFSAVAPRGEFTLVIAGSSSTHNKFVPQDAAEEAKEKVQDLDTLITKAMNTHQHRPTIIKELAITTGLSRRQIYARWQALRHSTSHGTDKERE